MNKPILVNNQQEWIRLAPVMEKQGYNWNHPLFKLPQPSFGMKQMFNEGSKVVMYLGEDLQWSPLALHDSRPTQSVNEYLSSQEPKKDFRTLETEPNYKFLYESELQKCNKLEVRLRKYIKAHHNKRAKLSTQTKAIAEALEEIDVAYNDCYINSPNPLESQLAYKHAKEILTQKLGNINKKA